MKIKSRPWLVPCLYPTISRISDRHWYCQSSPALSSPCRNQLRLKIQVTSYRYKSGEISIWINSHVASGNTLKTKENSGIILHQPFLKSSEKILVWDLQVSVPFHITLWNIQWIFIFLIYIDSYPLFGVEVWRCVYGYFARTRVLVIIIVI